MKRLLALPAVVLLTATCRDAARITQPDTEPPGQFAQLSQAALLASGPITVTYADTALESISLTISNDNLDGGITFPAVTTHLRVPMFDPTLGQLLSARLVIEGWLVIDIRAHARNPGFASFVAGLGGHARLEADPVVERLIGAPAVELSNSASGSQSAFGLPVVDLVALESKNSTYDFDRTYLGADADEFVRSAPGFDELTFRTFVTHFLRIDGGHSGSSIFPRLDIAADPVPGPQRSIDHIIFILNNAVTRLGDHGEFSTYSDMHGAAGAQFQMQVTYVYQPNRPPVCTAASPNVAELWPPNGRMVPVDILGVSDPDGDPVTLVVTSIQQDEPTNGDGDGNRAPDGAGVGSATAQLRAERSGFGNGRVYHIGFDASDGRGGACSGTVRVGVPYDMSSATVDDGALYNSTQ